MKVLVVGFSKTGTKSMNAALTLLGYKVYDYEHNFHYLGDRWIKILTKGGTKEDFYEMYKDVDASVDVPVCLFWEELLEAFPDMKLIFMRRKSEEDWLMSWERQVKNVANNYEMKVLTWLSPTGYRFFQYIHHVSRIAFGAPPQRFYQALQGISPTVVRKRYRDHNTSVMARAPKAQTLEFKMSDGWAPICKFLGKDIPEVPFPHKNQRGSVLDDMIANSPVFARMKQEVRTVVSIAVMLIAITVYFFLYHF